jgi:hypothetical protein
MMMRKLDRNSLAVPPPLEKACGENNRIAIMQMQKSIRQPGCSL